MRRVSALVLLITIGFVSGCLETRNCTDRPDAVQNAAHVGSAAVLQKATAWKNRDGRRPTASEYDEVLNEALWEADLAWRRRNLEWDAYQQDVLGRPLNPEGVAPVSSPIPIKMKKAQPPAAAPRGGSGWY